MAEFVLINYKIALSTCWYVHCSMINDIINMLGQCFNHLCPRILYGDLLRILLTSKCMMLLIATHMYISKYICNVNIQFVIE